MKVRPDLLLDPAPARRSRTGALISAICVLALIMGGAVVAFGRGGGTKVANQGGTAKAPRDAGAKTVRRDAGAQIDASTPVDAGATKDGGVTKVEGGAIKSQCASTGTTTCRTAMSCQRDCEDQDNDCRCRCASLAHPSHQAAITAYAACAHGCGFGNVCIALNCKKVYATCLAR